MKLKKVIKYLNTQSYCKIWIDNEKNPIYEGSVMDIPWHFLDCSLCNDDKGEAIWAGYDEEATNPNYYRSYFAIYLLEEN